MKKYTRKAVRSHDGRQVNKLATRVSKLRAGQFPRRKAKGFSKVNVKGRMSRAQTKQINDAYNDIIKKLSSSHKEKITETISKFQKSFRHKLQEKKNKSKKVPKYKSSKYFKTLQEIPKPITDKILTSIGEKYELADNTVGLMVSNVIELFKLEGKIVSVLEMIKEVYSKLLFHIIKWIHYVDHIRALQRPNSSDEDEEIPDWVENQIFKIRTIDMPKTGKGISETCFIINNMGKELKNFTDIIKIENTTVTNFINAINKNWLLKLDKFESERNLYNYKLKYEEIRKNLNKDIINIGNIIIKDINTKILIMDNSKFSQIDKIFDKIINEYQKYLIQEESNKKLRHSKSRR